MAQAVVADDLAGHDLSVFHIIDLKLFRSSEVLEDISVIVGYCDLHFPAP